MKTTNEIKYTVDTPEPVWLNPKEGCFAGWLLLRSDLRETARLEVESDGKSYPAFSGLSRDDVARHFENPDAINSGFVARFPFPRIDPTVRLVLRTWKEDSVLHEFQWKPSQYGLQTVTSRHVHERVSTYQEWLEHVEPTLFWPHGEVRTCISELRHRPLISVIAPLYNTPPYFLERCVNSVLQQHYANLQLCLVDDCSTDPRVAESVQRFAASDDRVSIILRKSRGGISNASNDALGLARGEFIVLLDHDDELHPFALLEVVRALNANERVDLFYSDEDKIDIYGVRSQPSFKPDFDPDIFSTFNYLGHLIALRRRVALSIRGFRPECDGAQDWDLLMRAVEAIDVARVHHIEKPLYHWRMHESSTAYSLDAKPYVRQAWVKVLSEHLARTGKKALIEPGIFDGSVRVKYKAPENLKIGVVVRAQDGPFQSIVLAPHIDESSTSVYELIECSLRPITPSPVTDPKPGDLLSLVDITGDVFIFVNRPLEAINHSFFRELTSQAMRGDCGIVTGICLSENRKILHSGFIAADGDQLVDPFAGFDFPGTSYMGLLDVVRSVEAVGDYFFAVRRDLLRAAGGMGAISASQMPRFLQHLVRYIRDQHLRILVTPYAIATVTLVNEAQNQPITLTNEPTVRMNSNIAKFIAANDVYRAAI